MNSSLTAIIHLREPFLPVARTLIEPTLRAIRGVDGMHFEPADSTIAVQYDSTHATIAQIVRAIEDCGPIVAGVAQRHNITRKVG